MMKSSSSTFVCPGSHFINYLRKCLPKLPLVNANVKTTSNCISVTIVFLFRVGKQGVCGSSLAVGSYFGIGKGSVNNCVKHCISALHEIHDQVVYWPDSDERDAMKACVVATGFCHCIGIIDGTLVGLDIKPQKYHECYYSHKSFYALNIMVVCNDLKRITYYLAGWPGSTHNNRVFRNLNLYMRREEFFSHMEYLLGDLAYSASNIMVPAFKKHALHGSLPHAKNCSIHTWLN
jgi:hypothetical protein